METLNLRSKKKIIINKILKPCKKSGYSQIATIFVAIFNFLNF